MGNNPGISPVIEQVRRLRAAQAARETAELRRLVEAYQGVHMAAQREAELLAAAIQAAGPGVTQTQVMRMRQYQQLMATTQTELEQYRGYMEVELKRVSRESITAGESAARALTRLAAQQVGVDVGLFRLNPLVIEELVGFLDPRGPLYKRLGGFPGATADQMSAAIIEGVGLGKNPRTIAAIITDTLGMGLTDSMRMMRTTQLWSYREANRASYLANSEVVANWIWYASLDELVCASCVAMHGTVHALSEPLNDHHNGRCAMIPMMVGAPNWIEPGTDWFESQGEAMQRAILGGSKFEAWRAGDFAMADVSGVRINDVYGPMRVERSLKDLVGGG